MEKLREHQVFLQMLAKSNPKYRKLLLGGAPNEIIDLLGDCSLNILNGNVKLSGDEKKKLRKHKNALRQVADTKVGKKKKKKILQEGAGMVPAILKPILKAVIPIIANQIVKAL